MLLIAVVREARSSDMEWAMVVPVFEAMGIGG